jgi:hypothetical protein
MGIILKWFFKKWDGDNIKMVLQEVGWGAWTDLVYNRDRCLALENAVVNLRVP